MDYVLKNRTDKEQVITGLGVLGPGETKTFSEQDASWFRVMRGIPLNQDNMPREVDLTIRVDMQAEEEAQPEARAEKEEGK